MGGQVIGRNARRLNLREQIERIRAQAPATLMRPSKPALPERARPQDLAPTVENVRRLGLPETTRPAANRRPSAERPANEPPALTRYLDHAGRAVNAAVNAIAEPVAMAVDLGMAGVGAAYTATTGKPADMPVISFASQDVADGATAADLLNGMNPVYGLMVTAHEIGRAISFNDTGALAEIGGALIGGSVGDPRGSRIRVPGHQNMHTWSTDTSAASTLQRNRLRMQLAAEDAAGVRAPVMITEYSQHAIERMTGRDGGIGANKLAVRDAFANPVEVQYYSTQYNPVFNYIGRYAAVAVNPEGRVTTVWSINALGTK